VGSDAADVGSDAADVGLDATEDAGPDTDPDVDVGTPDVTDTGSDSGLRDIADVGGSAAEIDGLGGGDFVDDTSITLIPVTSPAVASGCQCTSHNSERVPISWFLAGLGVVLIRRRPRRSGS
jgi:hypothetical protein